MSRLKWVALPLLLASLASAIYVGRIHSAMVDFEVYRTAAVRALEAQPLYRPDDGHWQFKYLPVYAQAMFPFAIMEHRIARLVWYAMSFGLLCTFVRWSVTALPGRRLPRAVLVWGAILIVGKYYARELNLGQSNILLGVTLMAALLAAESGTRWAAGLFVALGIFIKPYAVILVPWLWLVAGAPGMLTAGIVTIIGLAAPAVLYGWAGMLHQTAEWYRTVTETSAPNLLVPENISFGTTWAKWIGVGSTAAILTNLTRLIAIAAVGFVFAKRRSVEKPAYLEFGLLLALVPLLSPQGWDYVLLIATPAFLILIDRWKEMTMSWRALTLLAIAGISLTIFDVLGRTLYSYAMSYNLIGVCAGLLVASLVNLRYRRLA